MNSIKVGIVDLHIQTLGGGERYVCTTAEILSRDHQVHFFVPPGITEEILRERFDVNLKYVRIATVPQWRPFSKSIFLQDICLVLTLARISAYYDVFVFLSNYLPLFLRCKKAIQIVQIPFRKRSLFYFATLFFKLKGKVFFKEMFRLFSLRYSMRKYVLIFNSRFTERVFRKEWGISGHVMYPPVKGVTVDDLDSKKDIILSVGRIFSGKYNEKKYDILIRAFIDLVNTKPNLNKWEYHIVGGVGRDKSSNRYLEYLRSLCKGYNICLHTDLPYDELTRYYQEAKIFWHATGYNEDEDLFPERMEHFGMSTVEAMSAGCVPIVTNKGGQREIITDGLDGFLWSNVGELVQKSYELITDHSLLTKLSKNAQYKSKQFNLTRFENTLNNIISECK